MRQIKKVLGFAMVLNGMATFGHADELGERLQRIGFGTPGAAVMVVMAAMFGWGYCKRVAVRVVPAASKNRVDEQQGSRQISDKCLHAPWKVLPLVSLP